MIPSFKQSRIAAMFVLSLALAALGGCGQSGKLVPVTGKVMVGDKPLTTGTVTFIPEGDNKSKIEPVGTIGADGTYTLATGTQPGAPAGKYRVIVTATRPSDPKDEYSEPVSLVNTMYSDRNSPNLPVEVVADAAPRAYDLKLKK